MLILRFGTLLPIAGARTCSRGHDRRARFRAGRATDALSATGRRSARSNVDDGGGTSYLDPPSAGELVSRVAAQSNVSSIGEAAQIPQTYEAHRPENVVHASLEQRGLVRLGCAVFGRRERFRCWCSSAALRDTH